MKIVYVGVEQEVHFRPLKPHRPFVCKFNIPTEVPDEIAQELLRGGHKFLTYEKWLEEFGEQSEPAPNLDELVQERKTAPPEMETLPTAEGEIPAVVTTEAPPEVPVEPVQDEAPPSKPKKKSVRRIVKKQ